MAEAPLLSTLIQEIQGIVAERNQLREQVSALKSVKGGANRPNRQKLTTREVTEIRRLTRTTGFSQKEVADIYDLNPATVSRIVRGQYHKGA